MSPDAFLDDTQNVFGYLLRIPAFGRPSDAFLDAHPVAGIADGVVLVRLAIAGSPAFVLVISDPRVGGPLPLHWHFSPLSLPVLCNDGGHLGIISSTQSLDNTTHGTPRDVSYQVQGLVLAREWEFESPLRTNKKSKMVHSRLKSLRKMWFRPSLFVQ